jgi:vesicle-fusing ATPase
LEGSVSSGKTATAAKVAIESDFPFIRMISADNMIGMTETRKCETLLSIFNDAYRSPLAVIIIDDIERIMEYTPVGHRFSNIVLQTLLILIKKIPPLSTRVMVIATTSIASLMEDVQVTQAFNVVLHVNQLQLPSEIYAILSDYPDLSGLGLRVGLPTPDPKTISVKIFVNIIIIPYFIYNESSIKSNSLNY